MRDAVKINCQEIRKRFETFRTPDGQKVKHKYVAEKLGIFSSTNGSRSSMPGRFVTGIRIDRSLV